MATPDEHLTEEQWERLDQAWTEFEEGDLDRAASVVEELMEESAGHPDVRMLWAALLIEDDRPGEAIAHLEAAAGRAEDPSLLEFYRASALFDLGAFEEAESVLEKLSGSDVDPVARLGLRAEILEHMGRMEEADRCDEQAHAEDPEGYPLPQHLSRERFEEVVKEASDLLPEPVRERLEILPVVIEDVPSRAILEHEGEEHISPRILGLFVGPNLREESVFEIPGIPATIFLFQRNLERACMSPDELREEIAVTLYHELGHYLGLDEEELEEYGVD